jgi:hypothetical protein
MTILLIERGPEGPLFHTTCTQYDLGNLYGVTEFDENLLRGGLPRGRACASTASDKRVCLFGGVRVAGSGSRSGGDLEQDELGDDADRGGAGKTEQRADGTVAGWQAVDLYYASPLNGIDESAAGEGLRDARGTGGRTDCHGEPWADESSGDSGGGFG